jgi:hypothetical protein
VLFTVPIVHQHSNARQLVRFAKVGYQSSLARGPETFRVAADVGLKVMAALEDELYISLATFLRHTQRCLEMRQNTKNQHFLCQSSRVGLTSCSYFHPMETGCVLCFLAIITLMLFHRSCESILTNRPDTSFQSRHQHKRPS